MKDSRPEITLSDLDRLMLELERSGFANESIMEWFKDRTNFSNDARDSMIALGLGIFKTYAVGELDSSGPKGTFAFSEDPTEGDDPFSRAGVMTFIAGLALGVEVRGQFGSSDPL
jgi:hypothetical protein